MHIQKDSFADGWRNVILRYTKIRTHLSSLESWKTQRATVKRFNCNETKMGNNEKSAEDADD